jgi:hypothetical protein
VTDGLFTVGVAEVWTTAAVVGGAVVVTAIEFDVAVAVSVVTSVKLVAFASAADVDTSDAGSVVEPGDVSVAIAHHRPKERATVPNASQSASRLRLLGSCDLISAMADPFEHCSVTKRIAHGAVR